MARNNFEAIKVGLASPERILEWSHGEVTKPETLNYRSQKPEKDGLFCERIFGPTKDWECSCGKYKKVRYKGVVCDRCGVEITKASVRRERMGHISLAAPVAHIWYLKGNPARMSQLLYPLSAKEIEDIIYFKSWVVTDPGETSLSYKEVLSEIQVRTNEATYGKDKFKAQTGAEAIRTLLQNVDVVKEKEQIIKDLEKANGDKRKKLIKRLETVNAFVESDNKPEWMVLTELPVIPPDLRPMLQLDGGRFATSDLNDLYRRVITRNNRLKKLLEIGTPSIIVQNEKRMLQEAVDALIDNGRRGNPVKGSGNRPLKSLSNSLKGKQGRFRQNLLGKRVDFSGRSVIAVGPDLRMYQCGLPREMAIQLYKPFVINELVNQKIAASSKIAEKLIDRSDPQIWDVLEEIMENHPVLLNRAPTLHRLGIQAFMPKLVEGRAIRLHPLVCTAFNADFDGDQMAVHLPLSERARAEAEILMMASNNILGPKDGKPIVTPSQDMVLGNFYLNMEETAEEFYEKSDSLEAMGDKETAAMWRRFGDNEGHVYKNFNEALLAYRNKEVHLHTRVAIPAKSLHKTSFTEEQNNMYLITTVGKLIFNDKFPADFPYINDVKGESLKRTPDYCFVPYGTDVKKHIQETPTAPEFTKKSLSSVIAEVFERYKTEGSSQILDAIKDLGFEYSTVAGMTISLADINVAPHKEKYVEEAKAQADVLQNLLKRGHLTLPEWEKLFSKLWADTTDAIGDDVMNSLPRKSPINMSSKSGARGNKSNFTQLAGMRGLMGKPTQSKSKKEYQPSIIEVPIYSSFREGLNVSEFFISTHGVRKGLTDTALKTAESGYLTRRLVDVAQDVMIMEDDCGTKRKYYVTDIVDNKDNSKIENFYDRIVGRFSQEDLDDPETGERIVNIDEYIDENIANKIVAAGYKGMSIRNVFTCDCKDGICRKCYGSNMATGKLVEAGEAVGIMAAQSIGEPGTQLTMRTFHSGGVANADDDITQGLPRVEELFEARTPKHPAIIAKISGEVTRVDELEDNTREVDITNDMETIKHKIGLGQALREWVQVGAQVKVGDKLTDGNVDPKEFLVLKAAGPTAAQNYILKEVKRVYSATGIDISDKHIEVIIKQMLKKVIVTNPGKSGLPADQVISLKKAQEIQNQLLLQGDDQFEYRSLLLGITKASVETESFLSGASFQETAKVLTDAVVNGKVDTLFGIKENVIIGKLIPAGTGSQYERESTKLINERVKELEEIREEKLKALQEESNLPSEVTGRRDDDDFLDKDEEVDE